MSQLLTQQKEHRKKRRNRRLLQFGLILFLLLAVFLALVFVSRMQRFRISTISVSGETLIVPGDVVSASESFLSGYHFGLFPRNNFLIYPNSALQKFLKTEFPRIDTIQTRLSGFKNLEIVLSEREQEALWCAGDPDQTATSAQASSTPESVTPNCYFLDNNGLIFSVAPDFSGNAYFKYYGDIGTTTPIIGQTYLSTAANFQDMESFVQSVSQTFVTPISVLASGGGDFTMYLSSGGKVYFNQSQPFSKSADNLKALLQTMLSSSSTADLNIDYIDLRFGDKLYYKMR